MFAAADEGHEVVRIFCKAGAFRATANEGLTLLMVAPKNGHLELVRFVLTLGADKNAARADGASQCVMVF